MNDDRFPAAAYQVRIQELQNELLSLRKRKNLVSWLRLGIVVLFIIVIASSSAAQLQQTVLIGLILAAIFIRLIILAVNSSNAIAHHLQLLAINNRELAIATGAYTKEPDGLVFKTADHPYANDLDIFGPASLYQYINRSQSEQGNAELAGWLSQAGAADAVAGRQLAVQELAPLMQWRQELQAYGSEEPVTINTAQKVQSWLQLPNRFSNHSGWLLLRGVYPVITVTIIILFIIDVIPLQWFSFCYVAAVGISSWITKLVFAEYTSLNAIVPQVDALYKSALLIEKNAFQSPLLKQVQERFTGKASLASASIKTLKKILDKFDYNLNLLLLLLLNPLLLWNLQLVFQLERWRTNNKEHTLEWFKGLGIAEALSALANLHFNHPAWVFPVFENNRPGTFCVSAMGHPLIPANKMVRNSFSTSGAGQIALITGSNMAGKSTFLRSSGINIVLAMAGAPVCAAAMTLSPMRVISSMRVADNLQESTSTFYAELKKLKSIIEAVNGGEKVFVLLDEILRGTNSLDRHTGTEALIRQLIRHRAVAMLATHDVELGSLSAEYPKALHNYHFDAQIAGEELFFDYQLKEGICKSINASLLMKKIGIEL